LRLGQQSRIAISVAVRIAMNWRADIKMRGKAGGEGRAQARRQGKGAQKRGRGGEEGGPGLNPGRAGREGPEVRTKAPQARSTQRDSCVCMYGKGGPSARRCGGLGKGGLGMGEKGRGGCLTLPFRARRGRG
jgi:hypothetical protein